MAIGTLIGAGLSLAGSIAGNIAASKERRKARRRMEQQLKDNKAWYERRYNEDATRRADANLLLTKTAEAVRQRNQQAKGRAALMGGTQDAVTAAKEANAKATADAAAKITAAGEARKDNIEEQYQANKKAIEGQQSAYDLQTAKNIASTTEGLFKTAGQIASNVDAPKVTDEPSVGDIGDGGTSGGGATTGSGIVNGMGESIPWTDPEFVSA